MTETGLDRAATVAPALGDGPVPFIDEGLAHQLAATLERRYLADFTPALWRVTAGPADTGRPLLRRVQSIGRPAPGEEWATAVPHALTASHSPGHAFVMVVHGDGRDQHIYSGGRRLSADAEISTESYLESQGAVFQANIRGLELGRLSRLDGRDLPDLTGFLEQAPATGILAGIPSQRGVSAANPFQSLDRLMAAVRDRCYAVIVVAEPLEAAVVDYTLDLCRRLKGEIHALVRRSVSRSESDTQGISGPHPSYKFHSHCPSVPMALAALAAFCDVAGLFLPGVGALGQAGFQEAQFLNNHLIEQETHSTTRTETGTTEVLNATAEACEALLQQHMDRLTASRSQGWWRTSVYLAADGEASLMAVAGALRGVISGDTSALDPLKLVRPGAHVVRGALVRAQTLELPFLVIEPAKAEYRALADHPILRGRLQVYGLGSDARTPLRLNPFLPVASAPLSRHIDLVKAVFNASFPMFAGISYVLEDAILKVYEDRGWSLHSSTNDLLGARPSRDDIAALVPSLSDLVGAVDDVLAEKSYAGEVHQNLGAALRSRLRSLMVGTKGRTLNTTRSLHAEDLFRGPAVVELRGLGDDEEKSFVMALLMVLLYEFAETRQGSYLVEGQLQHLTLVEEAHRLLRASRHPTGAESADPQAKAVTMFTDMLAEMRAYGEGFIVADQVPTKLAPDILKNSNVKILHRLVAPDDRQAAGSTINLTEGQLRHLATLQPGVAIVHNQAMGAPVLVSVHPPARPGAPRQGGGIVPPLPDRSFLSLNGACRSCPSPCDFAPLLRPADTSGLGGCYHIDLMIASDA